MYVKLKHWIYGSNLVFLQTDHRPLIQIFSKDLDSIENLRIQKLRMKVLHIPLQVTYIRGKSNCLVDILSREPCFVPTKQILNEHYKSQNLSNR